jgi:hypothetical protein
MLMIGVDDGDGQLGAWALTPSGGLTGSKTSSTISSRVTTCDAVERMRRRRRRATVRFTTPPHVTV